ncbi:hypothetical protein FF38_13387 [Lucilia cuprina]|uniref:Uncharacterized protein n=1 Tax=Lucilia cuprina TaxID=7375 RepID=A0A0L0CMD1_LUCCU|nr:hypothetical protein FF38_13387 [Lucilia cuprina]
MLVIKTVPPKADLLILSNDSNNKNNSAESSDDSFNDDKVVSDFSINISSHFRRFYPYMRHSAESVTLYRKNISMGGISSKVYRALVEVLHMAPLIIVVGCICWRDGVVAIYLAGKRMGDGVPELSVSLPIPSKFKSSRDLGTNSGLGRDSASSRFLANVS